MHHIHITHDKAIEFLKSCEALEGFIEANSIIGRLMIAMRASLTPDGISVDVSQGDTSIPKNTLETNDVYNSCPAWGRHVTWDIEMHTRALEHLANIANEIRHNNLCELPAAISADLFNALEAAGQR